MDIDFKNLGIREFEEMDLPQVLYKYRSWNNHHHKKILTNNEIYMASPGDFEDEFDCKVPIRYDLLTDKEIYLKYYNSSKKENPHLRRHQHKMFAREWQSKGLMRDKERLAELDKYFFKIFNATVGILSLSSIPDNHKMWNVYADQQNGFCVGFDTIKLLNLSEYFGGGGQVAYYDDLPIILDSDPDGKRYSFQIYSKLMKWKFENEYRLIKYNIKNRYVTLPQYVYKEIILGSRVEEPLKSEITSLCKVKFPDAKILHASEDDNSISLRQY